MNDEIVWEAPPDPALQPPAPYVEALAQVKTRPGAWARIRTGPSATIYSAKRRLNATAARTDEHWEFRNAPMPEEGVRMYGLFARYRTAEQLEAATRRKR